MLVCEPGAHLSLEVKGHKFPSCLRQDLLCFAVWEGLAGHGLLGLVAPPLKHDTTNAAACYPVFLHRSKYTFLVMDSMLFPN